MITSTPAPTTERKPNLWNPSVYLKQIPSWRSVSRDRAGITRDRRHGNRKETFRHCAPRTLLSFSRSSAHSRGNPPQRRSSVTFAATPTLRRSARFSATHVVGCEPDACTHWRYCSARVDNCAKCQLYAVQGEQFTTNLLKQDVAD